LIDLAPHIAEALATGQPVVALESALIAHGLPQPINLELAVQAQEIIRQHGAHAATIGIVAGRPKIGLTEKEIEVFALQKGMVKTNISNLAWVITRQAWGATTVSASLKLAHHVGIKVLATGGLGGVHRDVGETFDISSDLTVLAETPIMVVCSGAKAILDLPKTFEYLETMGVPVIGYQTDQFPAFFSRMSGIRLEMSTSTLDQIIAVSQAHWAAGSRSAVVIAVPIPEESDIPQQEIEAALSHALAEAERASISGKAITPFVLSQIEKVTAGRSLKANVTLILNNVRVAAELSQAWVHSEHPKT
jgi:pseudouridine-5'-phosphate glycosidase